MRFESEAITSREAPTSGARSVLLITSRSERVTPGPPFLGIFFTLCNVDNIDRSVCKVRGECGGKIVAAAFNENDLRVRVLFHHFVNGFQVH